MVTDFLKDWDKGGHTEAHISEKKAKHTPGPWQMHDSDYCPEEIWGNLEGPLEDGKIRGRRICEVDFSENEDGYANARLIAAAPDLLEALKEALEGYELEWSKSITTQKIRAAIAKAEGK